MLRQQQTTRCLEEIMCGLNYQVLLPTNTAGRLAKIYSFLAANKTGNVPTSCCKDPVLSGH